MINWYESIDGAPENVTGDSLRKILKSRHKISISQSCARFYENKHLCVSPFTKELGYPKSLLMAVNYDQLKHLYNNDVADI